MEAPAERRPWSESETRARQLAGARDLPPVIRDAMTPQLREFFPRLPVLFVAGLDAARRPAASILRGAPGFVAAPTPKLLRIDAAFPENETIGLEVGAPFGLIGLDFIARRRNRVNGRVARHGSAQTSVEVAEAFGNCPKYISPHALTTTAAPGRWTEAGGLDDEACELIAASDCFFLASHGEGGVDLSHRGGPPGFVETLRDGRLRIPDFPGNNYFNSFGNLVENRQAALLFPDFDVGGALRLSGRAEVDFVNRVWTFAPEEARWLL
jgi:predicted pyridoxine 5'-phosphate oxidase superfamily flavin-nucleotide-binding protein